MLNEEAKSEENSREIRVFFVDPKRAVSQKNLHFSPSLFLRGASNTHTRARARFCCQRVSLPLPLSVSVIHLVASFSQK